MSQPVGALLPWEITPCMPICLLASFFCRDLSENFIQAIPRKAFRGATDLKNL